VAPLHDLAALGALARRLRRARPAILHLHSAKAGALGRLAAHLAGLDAKLVYTPHGHVFTGYGSPLASRVFTGAERLLAPRADAIVGLTPDEVTAFRKRGIGRPERFCIIPSGVDLEPYRPPEPAELRSLRGELGLSVNDVVVGFAGRLETVKGPDLFLRLAGEIAHRRPATRFLVIGDGALREPLEERAEEMGLAGKVQWLGWREDLPRLLRAMDILALTSRNEGQGRILVEAMATGLPVVALRSGGVAEVVVEGETGLLAGPLQVVQAAEAVLSLADDPQLRRRLGEAGRHRARQLFSVSTMIARLEALYDALLAGRAPAEALPDSL
jgi:glycosyltransferase involved in cell wall biosynthesis